VSALSYITNPPFTTLATAPTPTGFRLLKGVGLEMKRKKFSVVEVLQLERA
jgi:hypothetical protein